jgi:hypothetical protein
MEDEKTKTKIKNALLAIIAVPMVVLMASEVEDINYWWVPVVAAIVVCIIIRLTIGGTQ